MGNLQIHYSPEIREQHVINIVDLETCTACGEHFPCVTIQLCDSIDTMSSLGLGLDDVATGVWISGPHKGGS